MQGTIEVNINGSNHGVKFGMIAMSIISKVFNFDSGNIEDKMKVSFDENPVYSIAHLVFAGLKNYHDVFLRSKGEPFTIQFEDVINATDDGLISIDYVMKAFTESKVLTDKIPTPATTGTKKKKKP